MVDSFIVNDHLMCLFCKQAAESVDTVNLLTLGSACSKTPVFIGSKYLLQGLGLYIKDKNRISNQKLRYSPKKSANLQFV
jgi:hypothetical protein